MSQAQFFQLRPIVFVDQCVGNLMKGVGPIFTAFKSANWVWVFRRNKLLLQLRTQASAASKWEIRLRKNPNFTQIVQTTRRSARYALDTLNLRQSLTAVNTLTTISAVMMPIRPDPYRAAVLPLWSIMKGRLSRG